MAVVLRLVVDVPPFADDGVDVEHVVRDDGARGPDADVLVGVVDAARSTARRPGRRRATSNQAACRLRKPRALPTVRRSAPSAATLSGPERTVVMGTLEGSQTLPRRLGERSSPPLRWPRWRPCGGRGALPGGRARTRTGSEVNGNRVTLAAPAISAGFSTSSVTVAVPATTRQRPLGAAGQAGEHAAGLEGVNVGHPRIQEHQLGPVALGQADADGQAGRDQPADVGVAGQRLAELQPAFAVSGDEQHHPAARRPRTWSRPGRTARRPSPPPAVRRAPRPSSSCPRRAGPRRRAGAGPARPSGSRRPSPPAASSRRRARQPAGPGTRPGPRTSGLPSSGRRANARSRGCSPGPAPGCPGRAAPAGAPCKTSRVPLTEDVEAFSSISCSLRHVHCRQVGCDCKPHVTTREYLGEFAISEPKFSRYLQ